MMVIQPIKGQNIAAGKVNLITEVGFLHPIHSYRKHGNQMIFRVI